MGQTSERKPAAKWALRALPYSLALYCVAILTSMAGMEIFSWLSIVLILIVLAFHGNRAPGKAWLWVDAAMLAFLLSVVVGALTTEEGGPGFVTIVGRVRWIIIYMALRTGLRWIWSPSLLKTHLALIGIMAVTGLYAVVQHFTGVDMVRDTGRAVLPLTYIDATPVSWRASGFYSSSMTYGHSAALALGFPLALLVTGAVQSLRARWAVALAGLLIGVGILASYTRGAWLAAAIGVLTVGAFAGRKVLIATMVAGAVVFGSVYGALPDVRARVASFVDPANESNRERFTIWQANWEMVKDRPVFGVGYGENERLIGEYYARMGITGRVGHAHNNFIQVLSGTGGIGAFAFFLMGICFLYMNLRLLWFLPRERRWERGLALGILGAQVAMHIGGMTECSFKDAEINHHYMFLMAILSVLYMNLESQPQEARV